MSKFTYKIPKFQRSSKNAKRKLVSLAYCLQTSVHSSSLIHEYMYAISLPSYTVNVTGRFNKIMMYKRRFIYGTIYAIVNYEYILLPWNESLVS